MSAIVPRKPGLPPSRAASPKGDQLAVISPSYPPLSEEAPEIHLIAPCPWVGDRSVVLGPQW
jgi:hypothetical protein